MNHRGGKSSDPVERSAGPRSHRPNWLKHRRLAKVSMAIATAAVIGAIGLGTAGVASASVVNLTGRRCGPGQTLQLLNQMMAQFNKTHPNIHVTESAITGTQLRPPPSSCRRSRQATRPMSSPSGGPYWASSRPTATSCP